MAIFCFRGRLREFQVSPVCVAEALKEITGPPLCAMCLEHGCILRDSQDWKWCRSYIWQSVRDITRFKMIMRQCNQNKALG
ncbi:uncharacterized protein B0I36DRAFT_91211 [Microdochium trichocladiopsis]|uniref:Uncharacterized protein n=1 Tax=Microdochium trichocladiopsis TaxID=1682393 RepID=A0A9P8YE83_9PEZI|nr:uncharacterized protein B0I36DRAFT_91211 [Microdochium trichocladiopsis]KAH7035336.1 hypothetical protein B0I36DRAFT_91211 [Microdochium trichocladiopsis]